MSFGGDGSTWFTGILMALTVVVGLLGISRDHHRTDGKLTRLGWGLVAAIILLGVVTFLSGLRDKRIADEKEHSDAAERDRQFHTQMNALRGVTGSLSELQTGMRGSLTQQERLFGVASRTLGMSAALQAQAQANTLSVLRRVFQESNRISAERIAVAVTYQCPAHDRFQDNPTILDATLVVRGPSGRPIRLVTRQATPVGDGLVFHGFLGDLDSFETFSAWGQARISIRLGGGDISFDDGIALVELAQLTEQELQRRRNPAPVSCPTRATLLLNGRQVLSAAAVFARLTLRRDYAAEFENLRVEPHRLPRFSN